MVAQTLLTFRATTTHRLLSFLCKVDIQLIALLTNLWSSWPLSSVPLSFAVLPTCHFKDYQPVVGRSTLVRSDGNQSERTQGFLPAGAACPTDARNECLNRDELLKLFEC